MVTLFHPWFTAALIAVAVPVIIHFLFRKKTTALTFSTIRFLKKSVVAASRSHRLKRRLLMAVRCAILGAIALIFMRPFDGTDPLWMLKDPSVVLYVWIDNSPSMFTRALAEISPMYQADALYDTLSALTGSGQKILRYNGRSGLFEAAAPADTVALSYTPVDLLRAYTACHEASRRGTSQTHTVRPSFFIIISDFGEATAAAFDSIVKQESIPVPVLCITTQPQKKLNSGIADARFSGRRHNRVEVIVKTDKSRQNKIGIDVVTAQLHIGHADLSINNMDTATCLIPLAAAGLNSNARSGYIEIATPDPFPFDNRWYFSSSSSGPARILIIGEPDSVLPIAGAFGALGPDLYSPVIVKKPTQVSSEDLDSAHLIVFDQIEATSQAITAFVNGSTAHPTAIIFSAATLDRPTVFEETVYQRLMYKNAPRMEQLTSPIYPAVPKSASALWSGFGQQSDPAAQIFARCRLSGVDGNATTLIFGSDRLPLVTGAFDQFKNYWIVCATPLGKSSANRLFSSGFFVPAIDRLSSFAISTVSPRSIQWTAGVAHKNPLAMSGSIPGAAIYEISGMPVGRWNSQPYVTIDNPGLYRIVPMSGSACTVAVNMDRSESKLTYTTPQIPAYNKDRAWVTSGVDAIPFITSHRNGGIQVYLWVLLGMLLLIEMLLWGFKPVSFSKN